MVYEPGGKRGRCQDKDDAQDIGWRCGTEFYMHVGLSLCTRCQLCYTEKAPNAWQRRGTQKTRNTYNQPNRPNRQTSQTKHQALPKVQPGRCITPTQQPCTRQHNNPPSAPTPDRVITRSFQPTQPAAKPRSNTGGLVEQAGCLRRRAEPHNTIDTTRLSGDTQRPPAPPAWGEPVIRSGRWPAPSAQRASEQVKGGRGGMGGGGKGGGGTMRGQGEEGVG